MKLFTRYYSRLIFLCFFTGVFFTACKEEDKPLFELVPPAKTNISFTNRPAASDSLNFLDYLYYYNGGGVAVGDINNDGLTDIYFTANNKGGNKLYLNKGGFVFEDITAASATAGNADWCTGVTMADVNGDGWLDIYICAVSKKLGLHGANQLFINDKNGHFTESAAVFGLDFAGYGTQAVFFDYDHDGDLDCYLLNQSSHSVQMYGDTSLRKKADLFAGDKLMRNEGATAGFHFTDVTASAGIYDGILGYGLGVAVADINNDGWEDIYIGNDFHENDYYYVNNHDGTFTESGAKCFNHYSRFSMGNDIADYNNDGQPDIVTADMLPADEKVLKTYSSGEAADIYNYSILRNGFQNQYSKNALQTNLGNGQAFSEVSLLAGVAATDWSWSPLLADYDNDGNPDLFVSNGIIQRPVDLDYLRYTSSGFVERALQTSKQLDATVLSKMPDGKMQNYIFKGDGAGNFSDKSYAWGMRLAGSSTGAAYADFDNDGKLDLVVNNVGETASIYRNSNTAHTNFVSISCKGNNVNTMGIGCKVWLFNKGKIQYRQVMATRGFQSSSALQLHFGLDTLSIIDSLLVVWPDQHFELQRHIKANQQLIVKQSGATGKFDINNFFPAKPPLFKDVTNEIDLHWKHTENDFIDFNHQRLIPHALSDRGPKLAIADINKDGLDDFYVCGASGQAGALFIQLPDGRFLQKDTAVFSADKMYEDTDALFFDANGDGNADLYVASGGNEWHGNNPLLLDRLYINDGNGNFKKSAGALPGIYQNKSAVTVADIDHDGDADIFIGVLADAAAYGLPQTSNLLLNDGKGHFKEAADNIISLKNIGMVTAAAWSDLNKDGWPDLVVTGEWMPVKIFMNKQGKFTEQDIPVSAGLWQSLCLADIDGDGDTDILAGNYGTNSKLHAGKDNPLQLYVKDFDHNNTYDQLMTYETDGKEYTFLGKDELEVQLPFIKKTFLKYSDFAGKTVQEVFGDQLKDAVTLKAQTLEICIFINDGKSNFTMTPLNREAQVSPVFSFLVDDLNHDGKNDILSGGNFYGVSPYEGRYDANWGNILMANQQNSFNFLSPISSGFLVRGETRDIKKIKTATGVLFAVAKNNGPVQFFRLQ